MNWKIETFLDLNQNSWGSLGIDLALGSKIDQIASVEEHMFLPKYLYQLLANARLKMDDSKLISTSKTLNPSSESITRHEVEVGKNYAIIVTTNAWGYQIFGRE